MTETDDSSEDEPSKTGFPRRPILKSVGGIGAAGLLSSTTAADRESASGRRDQFDVRESTIAEVHEAMQRNRITAEALTERYLTRIEEYDEELNAILTINENALERAAELDERLDESGPVGPLHGIPLVLKDNFNTEDMPTTGGSATLENSVPDEDATSVRRLREAGCIVVAKANMHEFAYGWESYSSLGGQTYNPYDTSRVPGGSSGGSSAATAANLATLATGSDTCGSNRVPQAFTNLVGIRGTAGLLTRDGMQPMSKTQDIPGPMTRTVTDAAIMLDVMVGYDSADPWTAQSVGNIPVEGDAPVTTWPSETETATEPTSYTDFLEEDGLEGARIGVLREYLGSEGDRAEVTDVIEAAIDDIETEGATVVDPLDVPFVDLTDLPSVTTLEFRREFDNYLESIDDPDAPADLEELVSQTDDVHPGVLPALESALEVETSEMDENTDYLRSLVEGKQFTEPAQTDATPGLRQAMLTAMAEEDLDAVIYPTVSAPPVEIPDDEPPSQPGDSVNCTLSAASGLPAITIPAGFTETDELPVGLELLGRPFDEGGLLELSYSYEQATQHRCEPAGFGPVSD